MVVAPLTVATTAVASSTTGTYDLPYSDSSPWNTRIGTGAKLSGATDARVTALRNASPVINRDHWSISVYRAKSSDPLVTLEDVRGNRSFTARIPSNAVTTGGYDKHMTVVQPDGVTSFDAYKMEKVSSSRWRAQVVHQDDLRGQGVAGGVRAAGVPALAGLIRAHELTARDIPHALALAVPGEALKQGPVWPAIRQDSDAATSYSGPIPMGTLFVLPSSVDVGSLGLSAEGRALATALQRYGAYVVDRSSTAALYCELDCDRDATERMKADWRTLAPRLRVVTNSSPTSVGGGGAPAPSPSPSPEPTPSPAPKTGDSTLKPATTATASRLAGPSRYETAVAIGREAFPTSSEVVVVAGSQTSVVDGLVAAPFAHARKAPVLLSGKSALGKATRDEVRRRKPTRAWVIGGTGVLSGSVVTELRRLGVSTVTRLSGSDRYATAAAVAARMPAGKGAIVASGANGNLIDAAAVSGAAAATGRPVLLTRPKALPKPTADALRSRGATQVTVVGGTGAVSNGVTSRLERSAKVTRVGGANRFATASRVADAFATSTGTDRVVVAGGSDANLIDAMTAGVLGEPVLLTYPNVPAATSGWIDKHDVEHVTVVGGTGVIPTRTVQALQKAR